MSYALNRLLRRLRVLCRKLLRRLRALGWLQDVCSLCGDVEIVLETFATISQSYATASSAVLAWTSHKDIQTLMRSPLALACMVVWYAVFMLVSMAARKAARDIRESRDTQRLGRSLDAMKR
jgi:hypothetical protein